MEIIHTYQPRLTKVILLCLFMLSFPIQSFGRDVSFSWTANSEPSVIGYHLHYKEGSAASYDGTGLVNAAGQTDNSPIVIDGANTVSYTVAGLSADKTYQFVLTAFDNEQESDHSTVATVYSNPSPTIISIRQ